MKNAIVDLEYLADDKHLIGKPTDEIKSLLEYLNTNPYDATFTPYGYFCFCPTCDKFRMTDRCACMCGSCYTCGYRWSCMPTTTPIYPTGRPFVWTI